MCEASLNRYPLYSHSCSPQEMPKNYQKSTANTKHPKNWSTQSDVHAPILYMFPSCEPTPPPLRRSASKYKCSSVMHPSRSVSHNPISNWKPDCSRLTKMRILRMNGVGLERCPDGLGKMGKLEILDLSNNNIQMLDQAAGALFKLKVLDLKNNRIEGRCTYDERHNARGR